MRTLFTCFAIALLLSMASGSSEAIDKVLGASVNCDPNSVDCVGIPLAFSTICTVSCPLRLSFSHTDPSRFWAANNGGVGACRTSTDSGFTWSPCTTQPFSGGSYQGGEQYAGASDGSVIAVTDSAGPITCEFKRSTDDGATWITTHFEAGRQCKHGNLEGQGLYCLGGGLCSLITIAPNIGEYTTFVSTDNGQSWTNTFTSSTGGVSGDTGAAWTGSLGAMGLSSPGATSRSWTQSGGTWTTSTQWGGTQGPCWGAMVYNGSPTIVCQSPTAVPSSLYTLRNAAGANNLSLNVPGALLSTGNSGGVVAEYRNNTFYLFATNTTSASSVWVTSDGGNNFTELGTYAVTTRGGNAFRAPNGCVYADVGFPTPSIVRVCL